MLTHFDLTQVQTVTVSQLKAMHGIKMSQEDAVLDMKVTDNTVLLKKTAPAGAVVKMAKAIKKIINFF